MSDYFGIETALAVVAKQSCEDNGLDPVGCSDCARERKEARDSILAEFRAMREATGERCPIPAADSLLAPAGEA